MCVIYLIFNFILALCDNPRSLYTAEEWDMVKQLTVGLSFASLVCAFLVIVHYFKLHFITDNNNSNNILDRRILHMSACECCRRINWHRTLSCSVVKCLLYLCKNIRHDLCFCCIYCSIYQRLRRYMV